MMHVSSLLRRVAVAFVLCGWAREAIAASDSFVQKHLPTNVQIGLTIEALMKARPEARDSGITSKDGTKQFAELVDTGGGRVAYWYRFKGDTLGAVSKSLMVSRIPLDHVKQGADAIQAELKESFAFTGIDQIVRSTGSQSGLLTAQHWKQKNGALEVYYVASNEEITVVFFDPRAFGKDDFFLGPERLNDIRKNEASVRELSKDMKREPSKAEPVTLVDLLGSESTAEKSPTSQTTAAATVPQSSRVAVQEQRQPESSKKSEGEKRRVPSSGMWFWLVGGVLLLGLVGAIAFGKKTG